MANRTLALIFLLAVAGGFAPSPTPPTSGIQPITNGKLMTPLNANGFPITNLDLTGSGIGPGGGGGSGLASITGDDGSATGLTLVISHTTGSNLTDPVFTLGSTLTAAHGGTGFTSLSALKSGLALDLVDNTSDASKPISTATQTALDLKLASADLAAFTGSSNIVTLGTIATGIWNGTAIASNKLPTLDSIAAPTAVVSLNAQRIVLLADPTGAADAANKEYVDAVAAGGVPHPAAATASTNNRTLSGEQTIDGVLTSTSRVLLKNQTSAPENGIYVTAAGAWARAGDANADAEISGSVFISGGTVNAGTTWALTTPQPITLDTDSLAYTQTGANTIYSATGGITLTGSQFSLTPSATLTLKGNNTGGTAVDTDLTYSTVKSALSLNNVENTALSTWGGSSNLVTLGTITSGTIPTARIQNITTTGGNLLTSFAATTNNTFIRINSIGGGGGVTQRLPSELLSDISGQTALTVTTPLALTVGGGLSIPAATDTAAGHLTKDDHIAFAAKVPPGRTITTTAPLRISTSTTPISGAPGSDFSANRTIDMPAATDSVDGFLTKGDHQTFIQKTPPDSQVNFSNNGTTTTPATWTTGATAAYETAGITSQDKFAFLPPSTSYAPGKRITYTDPSTGGNFGRWFRPATASGDFINNAPDDFKAFIAGQLGAFGRKSVEFEAVTASAGVFKGWQVVTGSSVFHVEDPVNAQKQFTFDASQQNPLAPGIVVAAAGGGVTVGPTLGSGIVHDPGFVQDIDDHGIATKKVPTQSDIARKIFEVGAAGSPILASTVTVTTVDGGELPDTIKVLGNVTAPLTIKILDANNYADGDVVMLDDVGGTVSSAHPITVTSFTGTDTFNLNGQTSFSWDEGFGRKALTSDNVSNWHVSITKAAVQPYRLLSPSGNTFTIVCDPNAVEQHARMVLAAGANNLAVSGLADGMTFDLWVKQPSGGTRGTLALPVGSTVGNGGLGVITLSNAGSKKDHLTAAYDGNDNSLNFDPVVTDYSAAPVPTAPSGLTTSGITANKIDLSWTDNSSDENGFSLWRCVGASCSDFTELTGAILANALTYSDTSAVSIGGTPTSYSYKIRAFNSGGPSAFSSVATGTTLAGGATAEIWEMHMDDASGPTANATVPNDHTADGHLNYSTDWTTTSLQNGSSSIAAVNLVAGMANPAPAATPVGTTGAVTYSYRVNGWKTASNLRSASSVATTTIGNATLSGTNYNHLTWTNVGADYYVIYRIAGTGSTNASALGKISGADGSVTGLSFDDVGSPGITTVPPVAGNLALSTDKHSVTAQGPVVYGASTNIISVSFWAKSSFSSTTAVTFIDGNTWSIAMQNPNKLVLTENVGLQGALTGTVPVNVTSHGSNINSGSAWHLITCVFDNATAGNTGGTTGNLRVYYDDAASAQSTTLTNTSRGSPAIFPNSAPTIGNTAFTGVIDDVRIYNHALDLTERTNLYNGNAQ